MKDLYTKRLEELSGGPESPESRRTRDGRRKRWFKQPGTGRNPGHGQGQGQGEGEGGFQDLRVEYRRCSRQMVGTVCFLFDPEEAPRLRALRSTTVERGFSYSVRMICTFITVWLLSSNTSSREVWCTVCHVAGVLHAPRAEI